MKTFDVPPRSLAFLSLSLSLSLSPSLSFHFRHNRMASSSHRRAERLRSLLSRSEALSTETDVALARCESDLGRAAELAAPTVARTQVRRWFERKKTLDHRETFLPSSTPTSTRNHSIPERRVPRPGANHPAMFPEDLGPRSIQLMKPPSKNLKKTKKTGPARRSQRNPLIARDR